VLQSKGTSQAPKCSEESWIISRYIYIYTANKLAYKYHCNIPISDRNAAGCETQSLIIPSDIGISQWYLYGNLYTCISGSRI
jgi:hypothetical protein